MTDLQPVLELFKEKRERLNTIIRTFEYLPKKDRKNVLNYLASFYRILKRPAQVKRVFIHDMGPMKDQY